MMRSLGQPPLHMLKTSHSRQYLRQARPFFLAEFALLWVLDHLRQGPLMDIADLVFGQNVMVAGIKIAVMLDHRHVAAGLAINAQRVFHA